MTNTVRSVIASKRVCQSRETYTLVAGYLLFRLSRQSITLRFWHAGVVSGFRPVGPGNVEVILLLMRGGVGGSRQVSLVEGLLRHLDLTRVDCILMRIPMRQHIQFCYTSREIIRAHCRYYKLFLLWSLRRTRGGVLMEERCVGRGRDEEMRGWSAWVGMRLMVLNIFS